MTGRISVIVPTQGRATLERLLESVAGGLAEEDECIVVIDTHRMDEERLWDICERVADGPQPCALAMRDAGRHTWGHDQLNLGVGLAADDNYLTFNDDDDVYADGAFDAIRAAIARDQELGRPRCHIFRFRAADGRTLPATDSLACGQVGGHCIVVPNLPGMVGTFSQRYEGDWDFIAETTALWGEDVVFESDVLAVCRP